MMQKQKFFAVFWQRRGGIFAGLFGGPLELTFLYKLYTARRSLSSFNWNNDQTNDFDI